MNPVVELRAVTCRYGAVAALEETSLAIQAGERLGIAGPSGAGKSTLARVLTLHTIPSRGEVRIDGVCSSTLGGEPQRLARRRFQLVFQDPGPSFVHHWKVWRIVAEAAAIEGLGLTQQKDLALGLLDRVRLPRAFADRFPLELSGGERRRVAIARALAASPVLLALDESLSGLDGLVQDDLAQLLETIGREAKLTLVTVSHDLRLLRRLASRILILDGGRVHEDGPAQQVIAAPQSGIGQRLRDAAFGSV